MDTDYNLQQWTADGHVAANPQMFQLQPPSTSKFRRCNSCQEDFSNQAAFGRHLKTRKHAARSGVEYKGMRHQCEHCVLTFSRASDLRRHAHLKTNGCRNTQPDSTVLSQNSSSMWPQPYDFDQLADHFKPLLAQLFECITWEAGTGPKNRVVYVDRLEQVLRGTIDLWRAEKQVQEHNLGDLDSFLDSDRMECY